MDQKYTVPPKYTASIWIVVFISIAFLLSCILTYKLCMNRIKRMYAQHILSLPKLQDKVNTTTLQNDGWQTVYTQSGDTLTTIFKKINLSQQILQSILSKDTHTQILSKVKPNQEIKFLIHNNKLEQMIFPISVSQYLEISLQNNNYVSQIKNRKIETHEEYLTATIENSLLSTAKQLNIPYKVIHQMTEIFNWEIDFARDVQAGDQFSIL